MDINPPTLNVCHYCGQPVSYATNINLRSGRKAHVDCYRQREPLARILSTRRPVYGTTPAEREGTA